MASKWFWLTYTWQNTWSWLTPGVDLHLIKHDVGEHNHPVTTISYSAQHVACTKYFCKLDCSQAYHCIEMADGQSRQLLSFRFVLKTFAHKRLDQVSKTSLSAFTSVIGEYLDPSVEADWCAQYVDDIGVAALTASELNKNLDLAFKQIQEAGLKTSIGKCQFGKLSIEILGETIATAETAPMEKWITKFLRNFKLPSSVKTLQRFLGFLHLWRW